MTARRDGRLNTTSTTSSRLWALVTGRVLVEKPPKLTPGWYIDAGLTLDVRPKTHGVIVVNL